ncbi:MAG: 2'-5' RNA ligase family protein [Candidatus Shapirobacteria bacterium]
MRYRYFVAIPIASEAVLKLKDFYENIFLSKLPVKNIHLTLVAPFFIKEGKTEAEMIEKINEIKVYSFMAKFVGLDVFEQKSRKILFAKVEPEIEFKELSEKSNRILKDLIEMDTSPYSTGTIPSFKPHVTIDYDFREIVPENFQEITFNVEKMLVFKGENGLWKSLE